eukprot:SAG31_NODE_1049_length_10165_cov_2.564077_2_plen_500_part_00
MAAAALLIMAKMAALRPAAPASAPPPTILGMLCSNAAVASGEAAWSDFEMPAGWTPLYATVLQRHWDRWLYEHSLIGDVCWPGQLNSTSPPMPAQCGYNTSSVWESWPRQPDPYSRPLAGACTCPQLTQQGVRHAAALGRTLKTQYGGMLDGCRPGSVGLETARQQKNEMSLQVAYSSLCGKLPDAVHEFPYEQVVAVGVVGKGRPFFLEQGLCKDGGVLARMEAVASAAKASSAYWRAAHQLALEVARHVGQPQPALADTDAMLDNVEDCLTVHACHGLADAPAPFVRSASLFTAMDTQETTSRSWALNYFRDAFNQTRFTQFAALYYGYYFKVLLDRMAAAIATPAKATRFNLQVLSDSNLTPLLTMLGAGSAAARRPVWGSTIAFELWQAPAATPAAAPPFDTSEPSTLPPSPVEPVGGALSARVEEAEIAVRVIFNGKTLQLGGSCAATTATGDAAAGARLPAGTCSWTQWRELLAPLIPTARQCPEFYSHWTPP